MVVVAWILLVVFGLVDLLMLRKIFVSNVNILELIVFVSFTVLCALCSGIIWGGLTF